MPVVPSVYGFHGGLKMLSPYIDGMELNQSSKMTGIFSGRGVLLSTRPEKMNFTVRSVYGFHGGLKMLSPYIHGIEFTLLAALQSGI